MRSQLTCALENHARCTRALSARRAKMFRNVFEKLSCEKVSINNFLKVSVSVCSATRRNALLHVQCSLLILLFLDFFLSSVRLRKNIYGSNFVVTPLCPLSRCSHNGFSTPFGRSLFRLLLDFPTAVFKLLVHLHKCEVVAKLLFDCRFQ